MGDSEGSVDHDHCSVCGCSKEQYHMLRQRVEESKQRITLMESEFLQSTLYTENELDECREELRLSQQRYNALEKSHQELHEINSDLEERILDIAAAYEKEKQALNREVLTLSQRLLDTKFEINKQEERNARYKKDCQLAVELLQCTPSGAYMQHKVSQLPHDLQYYVHQLMGEMNYSSSSGGGGGGVSSGNQRQQPAASHGHKGSDNVQPLLGSSGSGKSSSSMSTSAHNGYLSARVYDSVPANVIARAMQLRDEEDRKEVEKLVPALRASSRSKQEVAVALHDKGTQTAAVASVASGGGGGSEQTESLCARCGSEIITLIPIEKEPARPEPEHESKLLNLLDLSEPAQARPAPIKTNENLLLDLLDTGGAPPAGQTPSELSLKRSLENLSLADLLLDIPNAEPMAKPLGTGRPDRESETPSTADIMSLMSPIESCSPMQDDMSDSSSASKESHMGTPSSVGSSLTEADAALVPPKPAAPKPTGPARRVQSGPTHPQILQNQKNNSSSGSGGNSQGILTEGSQGPLAPEPEFKKVGKAAVIKSQQRSQRSSAVVSGTARNPTEETKSPAPAIKDHAANTTTTTTGLGQKGSSVFHNQNQAALPETPSAEEKTERVSMYVNETNTENLKKKGQTKARLGGGGGGGGTATTKPTGQVIGSQHNRPSNPRPGPNPANPGPTPTPNLNSAPSLDEDANSNPTTKANPSPAGNPTSAKPPHFLQTSV